MNDLLQIWGCQLSYFACITWGRTFVVLLHLRSHNASIKVKMVYIYYRWTWCFKFALKGDNHCLSLQNINQELYSTCSNNQSTPAVQVTVSPATHGKQARSARATRPPAPSAPPLTRSPATPAPSAQQWLSIRIWGVTQLKNITKWCSWQLFFNWTLMISLILNHSCS